MPSERREGGEAPAFEPVLVEDQRAGPGWGSERLSLAAQDEGRRPHADKAVAKIAKSRVSEQ